MDYGESLVTGVRVHVGCQNAAEIDNGDDYESLSQHSLRYFRVEARVDRIVYNGKDF